MTRSDRRAQALAASLAALAGFVDSIGFLAMGGFFVSFMSGNSTRLGVGLVDEGAAAVIAGAVIAAFVAGVAAAALLGRAAGTGRRAAILLLVGVALAGAAALAEPGAAPGAFLLAAFAMGAENMVFERDGEVAFGLTYMTGTLVRIGQNLAAALVGGPRWAWLPWLALWLGLVAGGVLGATSYLRWGLQSLWAAAAIAFLLALVAGLGPRAE